MVSQSHLFLSSIFLVNRPLNSVVRAGALTLDTLLVGVGQADSRASSGLLTAELLKSAALGLGDQHRAEDTEQHEEREDLDDVVEPRVLVLEGGGCGAGAAGAERADDDLRDDGADLTGSGGQTVGGGSVASGEDLTGDDEGGGVGAEVEEELREHEAGEQTTASNLVVGETDDAEEDDQHGETHELNGLAADGVNSGDGAPVTGDGTGDDEDSTLR